MAEPPPKPADPSMEDILASIRQILNEDEKQNATDRPLELTEDMMVQPAPPAPEAPQPQPELPPAAPATRTDAPANADAVVTALEGLTRAVARNAQASLRRGAGPSIEDVVREELRSLLKTWLDEHLPAIVERQVQAEIARLTGRNQG